MKKTTLGQFFTINNVWLKTHIKEFISYNVNNDKYIAFDPFAGNGDLLDLSVELGFSDIVGFDIDSSLEWKINDSLVNIPKIDNSFIITNPPYLSNYSAKRKGLIDKVERYYTDTGHNDLYKVALEKIFENNDCGVVIIPETFINSGFNKNRLVSITVLEDNPFLDTDTPVCVICFDKKIKSLENISVYKNDEYLGNLDFFYKKRLAPSKIIKMRFNDLDGQIALRAVDMTTEGKKICFMKKEDLLYNLSGIKNSSRLITIINIAETIEDINIIIKKANCFLNEYREETKDILFSPFKGNTKKGSRRRRIDYGSARAILEEVILSHKKDIQYG